MNTTQANPTLVARTLSMCAILLVSFTVTATAQSVDDVRWKSESQVRALLGEPDSTTSPVGIHASYTLWKYTDFTVAFADNRAFHLFKAGSLDRVRLNEGKTEN